MKVLLVGRNPRVRNLYRALRGPDRPDAIHFASGPKAVRLLLEAGNCYAFVIIHGFEENPDNHEMVSLLRKSNPEGVLAYLSLGNERKNNVNNSTAKLLAAFEKTADGKRILNCLLAPLVPDEGDGASKANEFIFEYQAPCRSA